MNLNKFTKAELISKFKKLESKNSNSNNNNQSILNNIIEKILLLKSVLIKITLISFLIKYLKKFNLFRRLWVILNTIVMSIFGISFLDNFGFEFISNFFKEIQTVTYSIVNYLSETHFYSFIASLFSKKEEVDNTTRISLREGVQPMSSEYTTNESKIRESKRNSKISEWLKPEEEIHEEKSNKKYYIIAGMLVISLLAWYYFDDIKPIGETSDLEFARRQLSPKLTGLTEIRSDNFEQGSGAVLNEIEQFFKYHHNSAFPKVAIQVGLYKTLRDRLSKLYETNNEEYNNLIQDEKINAKINWFVDLEKEIDHVESYNEAALSTIQEQEAWSERGDLQSPRSENLSQVLSPELTSYAIDNQNSQPIVEETSVQIPTGINTWWANITSRGNNTDVIGSASVNSNPSVKDEKSQSPEVDNKISQLVENVDQLDDSDLLDQVTKTFQEELGESNEQPDELIADPNYQQNVFDANKRSQISLDDLNENTVNVEINEKQEDEKEDWPNIDIDSSSSSNNHYFPKPDVTPQEIKTGFKSIIDNIDNNIIQSPSTN